MTAQHTTMAERRAWLSIPVFARPDTGLSYHQRMEILEPEPAAKALRPALPL
ncbi:hypothetical protein [Streptomyces californicus]|uniref:hypothetical protein n=1 Tax=Streptomyces californicus TaxID=67351 RepID=UPI00379696D6